MGGRIAFRGIVGLTAIGMMALPLVSCSSDNNNSGPGRVRVLHAAPEAPSVDVATGTGEEQIFVAQGLSYGSVSAYTDLDEGTYTFRTLPAGGDTAITQTERRIAGADFTILVRGIDGVVMQVLEEADEAPEGQVRIRAAHAAEDVGAVSIYDHTGDSDPVRIVDSASYGGVGSYRNVDPGEYVIGIDVDGGGSDLFFELAEIPAGSVVTIYAVNNADGDVSLLVVDKDGNVTQVEPASAELRVQNAVPDAPAGLDFYSGDTILSSNVLARVGTDYADIEGHNPQFRVTPNGESGNVILNQSEQLETGRYTFVVYDEYGDGGSNVKGLLLRDDDSEISAGQARIRLAHLAHTAGTVDVYAFADSQWTRVAQNVEFGTAASALDVEPSPTIGLDADRNGTVDLSYAVTTATAGAVINGYFMYDPDVDNVVLVVKPASGSTTRINPTVEVE